jgi:carbamoyl-phosphate synthase/aspartate carbamoyltransferase/dihydroorotase
VEIKIPAMLDPHVHLRGMDWAHKGTFASETAAALAGGYWAVFDMPNTLPSTIDPPALDRKLAEFGAQARCDWGVYYGAALTANWQYFSAIADRVCGLKIYNNQTTGVLLIEDQATRSQHYTAWPSGKIIAVHAEGETVLDILDLVRKHRRWTHFCHISSAYEIRLLSAAKEEGLPISIGVCPHHLYLSDADLPSLGPLGLMKPGLKTKQDQEALWRAVQSGVVDIIESDHAPHTLDEKHADQPVYGVPGLETTLPLLGLAVKEGRLSIERVIELVAVNPRKIWGLAAPPETYTMVDFDLDYTINRENLYTLCGWSPFEGMRVYGRVMSVVIRGRQVFDGEHVLAEPGSGSNLFG